MSAAVQALLEQVGWQTTIQPIVSIPRRTWLGLDATHVSQSGVVFEMLSEKARNLGLSAEVSQYLRRSAFSSFQPFLDGQPALLMFFQFDPSLAMENEAAWADMLKEIDEGSFPRAQVVVEISESRVANPDALLRFCEECRERGLLLAVSHLGTGFSTLSRVLMVRPDLVKISPWLLKGISKDNARREIVDALVGLSHKLGIFCLAEGVETEEDAFLVSSLKVDYVQGPFLALENVREGLTSLAQRYQDYIVRQSRSVQNHHVRCLTVLSHLPERLLGPTVKEFDEQMARFVAGTPGVDCGFILDEKGIQITDSHLPPRLSCGRNALLTPPRKGSDHSSQDYYFVLQDAYLDRYVTEARMAHSTGRLCHIVSVLLRKGDKTYIACVKVPVDYVENK